MPPVYEALLLNTVVPQIQAAQAGDSYVMVVNATTPALRITQTGTGDSILVEDAANPDSSPFVVTATGSVGIGLSSPEGKLHVANTGTAGTTADNLAVYFTSTNRNANLYIRAKNTEGSVLNFADGDSDVVGRIAYEHSDNSMRFDVSGGEKMRLDASGNLGLGVTPSAWGLSGAKAAQVINASFWGYLNNAYVSANNYNDGTGNKYIATGFASRYEQSSGAHVWQTAPSGTANTTTITNGVSYTIITSGNQTAFGAADNNVGTSFTATSSGTLSSGTVTQNISFTQAMTLDASGDLGVGTTSPKNNTGYATFTLNNVTNGGVVQFCQADTTIGQLFFDGNGGTLRTSNNKPMVFGTDNTERARITSGGEVLFGLNAQTNTPANGFVFQNLGTTSSQVLIGHSNSSGSGTYYEAYFYDSTVIGSVTQNGTTGVLYNITSDYRLKTVTGPVTDAGSRIDALEPVEYTWKANGSSARGFLAHKFQEVYPNSVTGQKDAIDAEGNPVYQNMQASTSEVIADLVAELQSLRARVAQLEAK
jgi:hypothetical protein